MPTSGHLQKPWRGFRVTVLIWRQHLRAEGPATGCQVSCRASPPAGRRVQPACPHAQGSPGHCRQLRYFENVKNIGYLLIPKTGSL